MTFEIPESLKHVAAYPNGSGWLNSLPDLLGSCVSQWDLDDIGPPFGGSNVSLALPARRGTDDVVLKIQYPDAESRYEADALQAWNGSGAVRLLEHDRENAALLLERCVPGTYLANDPNTDVLGVVTDLLQQLLKPVNGPFTTLADQAIVWAEEIPKAWERAMRPCERYLVDTALDFIRELSISQPDQVLLHQDLHGHNIISAEREPWLAIDPKPLVGEKAFSLAPIVRSFELGQTKEATLWRLDRLSADLGVDRERARGWTVAQTMAWGFGSDMDHLRHQSVRWLLDR
ncbi:MAG: aminoglycoside phosphotransferase family protein [Roseibium sp.]